MGDGRIPAHRREQLTMSNFTASLVASLGLKKSEFSAGLRDSIDETKNFQKHWQDVGKLFAAGGVTTAVLGFFRSMIEHARDSGDNISESFRSVREFGEGVDALGKGLKDFGVYIISIFTRCGESIGVLFKVIATGWEGVWNGIKNLDFKGAMSAAVKAFDEVIAQEKKLEQTEINLAETQRQIAKEGEVRAKNLKIQRQEEEDAARKKEKAVKEAADAEKKAFAERNELLKKKSDLEFEALSTADKIKALREYEQDLIYDITEKAFVLEDTTAEQVELLKVQAELRKYGKELSEDQAKTEKEKLASIEREVERMARIESMTKEQLSDEVKLLEVKIEKAKAAGLETAELEKQLGIVNEILRKKKQQLDIQLKIIRMDEADASDRVLEDKVATLNREIEERRRALRSIGKTDSYDPLIGMQILDRDAALKELQARDAIRRQVAMFGEEGAASRFYRGDMKEFERLLEFVNASPDSKKTNDLLAEINDRLRGVFPRN